MALTRATDKIIADSDGNLNLSGIITASSFIGSGSGLTGVASTDHIKTSTTANFTDGIQVGGATTLTGALTGTTGTFSGDFSIADKIVHTGDTDTAIRFPSADTIQFETGGSNKLSIGSSITSTTAITIHNADPELTFRDSNHSPFYYHFKAVGGSFNLSDSVNGNRIVFSANGSASIVAPTFVMTGGAQVSSNLGVTGNIIISDQIQHDGDTDTRIRFPAADTITAETGGSERLRIDSSGNVLVGTTDSTIYNQSSGEGIVLRGGDVIDIARAGDLQLTLNRQTNDGPHIAFYRSGSVKSFISTRDNALCFDVNSTTERLRIDSNGHLLHGVTSDEDTSGNGGLRFINTGDIQIDGDQKALVFRSTNSTAQIQSGIEWWNENGAGVQAKILCDRTATSKAPSDLVFYTNTDVDTSANNSEGDITEQLRIKSDGNSTFAGSITAQNYASRNLIINGDCSICQYRGITGETTGVGILTTDRWKLGYSGHDEEITQEHRNNPVTDAPSKLGISHSFQVKNGNQTSTGSSDYCRIVYTIESQDMRNSGWDFQNPNSYITLSFWCKSTVSKNFYGQLFCQDSPFRQRSFETGTISANTWTKVEIPIPGESSINFNHDVGPGLIIYWYLYAPTAYTSGNGALNTWTGNNGTTRVPPDSDSWWRSNNATFDITGVQLEVGSTATNFELKNYEQNLWECKRYYQRSTDQNRASNYSLETSTWHSADGVQSFNKHNNYYDFKQNFEREMRVPPTLTIYGSSNQGDIHLESVAVGSKQVDWNNNTTEVQTKGFLLRHIEDQSDGNYTSGSGNAFGILAYTLDAEF